MTTTNAFVVRIYVTESSNLLKKVVDYLINEAKIHGVSVFRAITGISETGVHTASLLDLSLDLPLAIEFFDNKTKVLPALEHLKTLIKPEHIVFWEAQKF